MNHKHTYKHNANTYIHTLRHTHTHTHTHSNKHMHTYSFHQSAREQPYIGKECTTIINIFINDHKTKILFPKKVINKC